MFGGTAPNAKPTGEKQQKPGDLLEDLKGLQRLSGMF
jgi:hypothetical protein